MKQKVDNWTRELHLGFCFVLWKKSKPCPFVYTFIWLSIPNCTLEKCTARPKRNANTSADYSSKLSFHLVILFACKRTNLKFLNSIFPSLKKQTNFPKELLCANSSGSSNNNNFVTCDRVNCLIQTPSPPSARNTPSICSCPTCIFNLHFE